MTRQGVLWSVGALLGIVCTAAIAWSATVLAGQHIGLSGVPLSAAGRLAPATPGRAQKLSRPRALPHPATVLPAPARSQPAAGSGAVSNVASSSSATASSTAGGAAPSTAGAAAPASAGGTAPSSTPSAPSGPQPSGREDGGAPSRGASESRQRDD